MSEGVPPHGGGRSGGQQPAGGDPQPPADAATTVEAEVRRQAAAMLGGGRGAIETALPFAVFTLVYVLADALRPAVLLSVGSALLLVLVRLVQRSSVRYVFNGLFAIALAAVIATTTGRAETAFLPGIIQSAAWALGLGVSVLVRWPAAGFVIGGVLGETTGWRNDPAIVRLANRLTLVLLAPMVVRVGVQYPLYLAGEVGWLGVTRVVLGWPLSVLAFAVVAAILARGRTPLHQPPDAYA